MALKYIKRSMGMEKNKLLYIMLITQLICSCGYSPYGNRTKQNYYEHCDRLIESGDRSRCVAQTNDNNEAYFQRMKEQERLEKIKTEAKKKKEKPQ